MGALNASRDAACSPGGLCMTDDEGILRLLVPVCGGDEGAWQELWRLLDPRLMALLRQRRFLARLSGSDDDRRAVVVAVMERLRQDGFRRLALFQAAQARDPQLRFMAWLTVVAKRVAIDYLRAHPDYRDSRRTDGSRAPGRWVEAQPLPSERRLPVARPPITALGTAGELLAYARRELPPGQRVALEMWIRGEEPAAIARALDLSGPAAAERTFRAALERLRRRFRTSITRVRS
jgi:DNA-directed RNA polymerase specialized sigma24 family protein